MVVCVIGGGNGRRGGIVAVTDTLGFERTHSGAAGVALEGDGVGVERQPADRVRKRSGGGVDRILVAGGIAVVEIGENRFGCGERVLERGTGSRGIFIGIVVLVISAERRSVIGSQSIGVYRGGNTLVPHISWSFM